MFVTNLGMNNFDCTKMNTHFEKFTAGLWEGLIYEWKEVNTRPNSPPYVAKQLTAQLHTQPQFSSLACQCSTNNKFHILVKATPIKCLVSGPPPASIFVNL